MRLIAICILLTMLGTTPIYAQRQGQVLIDSLLKQLPHQKEDTNKVSVLNALSDEYASMNPDKGIMYGKQGLELAAKLQWMNGIAWANAHIGVNYKSKSDYNNALEYEKKSLKIFQENNNIQGIAAISCTIGSIYSEQQDYEKAIEYFRKALEIDEREGYKSYTAHVYSYLGDVYDRLGDNTNALLYSQKSLKLFEELGDKRGVIYEYANTGAIYDNMGEFPLALKCYFKALQLEEGLNDKMGVATINCNISAVYYSNKDFSKALEYYEKALKQFNELGNKKGIATVLGNIGAIYCDDLKDYAKSQECFLKALRLSESIGDKYTLGLNLENMGNVYKGFNDYETAVRFYQASLVIADEIGDKTGVASNLQNIGVAFLYIFKNPPSLSNHTKNKIDDSVLQLISKYQPKPEIPSGGAGLIKGALNNLHKGLLIAEEIGEPLIIEKCYEGLAKAYRLNGDYKNAMDATDHYQAIKDSLFSKENEKKIIQQGVKFEYEKKEAVAKALQEKKDIVQKNIRYSILGGMGGLLIFLVVVMRQRNKVKKQKAIVEVEKARSEELLLNILPAEVAEELKAKGSAEAKLIAEVTVLFTDFKGFTQLSEKLSPQELVAEINTCFSAFDNIMQKHGVEKIKTIGDAYMAAGGLPTPNKTHADDVVKAAMEIQDFMHRHKEEREAAGKLFFEIRIGVHTGPVVAGIVGIKKFAYDIWGDTVNTASRMESSGSVGKVNISETTYELVKDKFACEYRGELEAKGKGVMKMYYVSAVALA